MFWAKNTRVFRLIASFAWKEERGYARRRVHKKLDGISVDRRFCECYII
ncbi:hypothetical protein HMPREF1985_01264 [Mitsuokella sp. oral taxon 131 str. W9106]|nr:hypothetical protein HMPREF1985_01264 [Mitsuokella sp. oral taxon 131 str. W9106]